MAGKQWTDKDLNQLKTFYPNRKNSWLAENIIDGRSADSISRKARRLGIEKDDQFEFKHDISTAESPETDESFENFLIGLLCAEGSFLEINNGDRQKFVTKIEMNRKHNANLFQEISDYIGVGDLSTYDRNDKTIQRYTVRSIPKNIAVICPIMERNSTPIKTWRDQQYREWKSNMLDYVRNNYGQECYEMSMEVIEDAQ